MLSCSTSFESSESSEDDSDTLFSSSSSRMPLTGACCGALSFTKRIAEISWTIESKKIFG